MKIKEVRPVRPDFFKKSSLKRLLFSLRSLGGSLCRSLDSGLGLLGAAAAGALLGGLLRGGCEGGLIEVDQLDQSHLGGVSLTETGVEHAGVSSRTVGDLRSDGTEELGDSFLVLQVAEHYAT